MQALKKIFSKDSTILVILFVLAIAGLLVFHFKEESIFPSASIDLGIDKSKILQQAETWATRFGYKKDSLIKSITFNEYDESKTFLEYELGNDKANVLMKDTIPIFYWYSTFRKPFDQETMDIAITPTGKLTYLEYTLANDKKIPSISHDEAQKKAFSFVNEITGWAKDDCKLVDDDTTARLNRTDHEFTWEDQKLEWHRARLRSNVKVAGDSLISFKRYLHRPEQWDRDYSTLRTKNELLEAIASVFFFLLYPAGVFIFLRGISRKIIRWRFAAAVGGVLTAVYLAQSFNSFPDVLSHYSPHSSFTAFLVKSILFPLLTAPFTFMLIVAMAGAGELVYRNLFPQKIALEKIFSLPGLASKEVLVGLLVGLTWFGASLGYQICYYWIGKHFNFWCPLEVTNYKALSDYWPWLSAASLGTFASSNEEILYRVLMLWLTKLVVRRFWLANLIQAAAWGFMHSTYPQQPCYARGLELTIEGMFDGWILSRFGLLACIVSHYSFDAFDCVVPLFKAPVALQLSSILPFVPILIAVVCSIVLYRSKKTSDQTLFNEQITASLPSSAAPRPPSAVAAFTYSPLSNTIRRRLIYFAIAGIAFSLIIGEKHFGMGEKIKTVNVSREQAIDYAQKYLLSQHINTNDYKIGTKLENILDLEGTREEVQYVYEQIGYDKAKALFQEAEPPSLVWSVRFVKPLEPSEYCCQIGDKGNVMSVSVLRGEDQSGANLSKEKAVALAEDFVKEHLKKYTPFVVKDVSQTKRKNRTDYHVTFEVPKYKVKDAEFRGTVDVIGDLVGNVDYFWDVPDKWKWARAKQTKRQEIYSIVNIITYVAIFVAFIIWIIALFRANKIHWRTALYISAFIAVGAVASAFNSVPTFFSNYASTAPLIMFITIFIIGSLLGILLSSGMAALFIAVILAGNIDELKQKFKSMLSTIISIPQNKEQLQLHWNLWLDALIFSIAVISVKGLSGLIHYGIDRLLKQEITIGAPGGSISFIANPYSGPLAMALNLAGILVISPLVIGLIIGVCRQLRLTTFWRFAGVVFLLFLLCDLHMRHWQDSLADGLVTILSAVVCWCMAIYILNRNMLSLFVLLWISTSFAFVYEIAKYGWPIFSKELVTSAVFLLYPFLYLLYLYTRLLRSKPGN